MQAVRFHEHGGPDVLRFEEAPDPVPGHGEALVRVRACALNHLDLWQRRGLQRVVIPLPHISGSDVAGEVVSTANGSVKPGTRVMVQPGLSCGRCPSCLSGRDNECARYDIVGYRSDGGYAELVKVPIVNLIPIPDRVPFVEAAAFPLTFVAAWHMLVARARVQPGEDVLVLSAGSGVGQAAIQVAVLLGARVLATAGTAAKLDMAQKLGASDVINHREQNITDEVRRITHKRGVDVVIEHVGEATWQQSIRSLAAGGRLVTCGATTGPAVSIDLRYLFSRQLSLLGSYMGTKGELLAAARFYLEGRLRPVVDTTFPLQRAADAQRYLEEARQFGKIVLEC